MRFRSIWTLRGMTLTERLRRTRDWAAMTVGRHLPKRVRYWTTISEVGKATMHSRNVPATTLDEIVVHLDAPKGLS